MDSRRLHLTCIVHLYDSLFYQEVRKYSGSDEVFFLGICRDIALENSDIGLLESLRTSEGVYIRVGEFEKILQIIKIKFYGFFSAASHF